jgi:hypothetical protein
MVHGTIDVTMCYGTGRKRRGGITIKRAHGNSIVVGSAASFSQFPDASRLHARGNVDFADLIKRATAFVQFVDPLRARGGATMPTLPTSRKRKPHGRPRLEETPWRTTTQVYLQNLRSLDTRVHGGHRWRLWTCWETGATSTMSSLSSPTKSVAYVEFVDPRKKDVP